MTRPCRFCGQGQGKQGSGQQPCGPCPTLPIPLISVSLLATSLREPHWAKLGARNDSVIKDLLARSIYNTSSRTGGWSKAWDDKAAVSLVQARCLS